MIRHIRSSIKIFWADMRNVKWAVISIIACFLFLYVLFGSICPVACLTGFPCPACGLTRAGISVLTLRFADAWELQPFIYPILLWLAAAAVQRTSAAGGDSPCGSNGQALSSSAGWLSSTLCPCTGISRTGRPTYIIQIISSKRLSFTDNYGKITADCYISQGG